MRGTGLGDGSGIVGCSVSISERLLGYAILEKYLPDANCKEMLERTSALNSLCQSISNIQKRAGKNTYEVVEEG